MNGEENDNENIEGNMEGKPMVDLTNVDQIDQLREIDDPDQDKIYEDAKNIEIQNTDKVSKFDDDFGFDDVDPKNKVQVNEGNKIAYEETPNKSEEYNKSKDPKVMMENIDLKSKSYNLEKYLKETGIPLAFQEIFSELLIKKVKIENYFSYTAMRLRQMNHEIEAIKNKESENK